MSNRQMERERPPRDPWRPVIFVIILLFLIAVCASVSLLAAPLIFRGRFHSDLRRDLPARTAAAYDRVSDARLALADSSGRMSFARPVAGGLNA